jgi:predicted dehydrogenase
VAYYRRALPRFLAVRDLVRAGEIGAVRMVTSRQFQPLRRKDESPRDGKPWRLEAARSGGGLFVDMMSHTLDFFDLLLGPIGDVRAFAANRGGAYDVEDVVAASFRFESGVLGSGAWCYAADREEEGNEIVGAKGRIRFSTTRPVPIEIWHGDACRTLDVGDPPHVHQPLVQSFVDELNGRGQCPSTGESALRTSQVVDAILQDYRSDMARRAAA